MNKLYMYAAGGVLLTALAFSASAIEPREGVGPPSGFQLPREMQHPMDVQKTGATEEVSGTVAQIDHAKGALALSSRSGTLKLHFPPASIRELKKGDTIVARLAIARAETGTSVHAYDAPKGLGEHRMAGTLTKVDHHNGWVTVKSGDSILDLRFKPEALRGLKQGDKVNIDMAFTRGA